MKLLNLMGIGILALGAGWAPCGHAAAEAGLPKFAPSLSAAMGTLRRILKAHSKRER